MLTTFKVMVLTIALAAFVFNVLSPDTPTPDGVVKDHSDGQVLLFHHFRIPSPNLRTLLTKSSVPVHVHTESILELTCARLC